jgi:hypothetical protein
MDMVSAVQHSLNLDLKVGSKKKGSIRKTGDGDGQMRLGYIAPEEEEQGTGISSEKPLRSDGYIVQFQSNPKARQYSGNVQRLSRRVGSLNSLRDNLEGIQRSRGQLEAHAISSGEDTKQFLEDPAELIAMATELEGFRREARGAVRALRDEGVAVEDTTRGLRLDLGDLESARRTLRELHGASTGLREFVYAQLQSADQHLGGLVVEKTPAREDSADGDGTTKAGDPLMAFMREVHTEMLEAGKQILSAQANLDPVKVYELLRE